MWSSLLPALTHLGWEPVTCRKRQQAVFKDVKPAQTKQTGNPHWCTWWRCHQLPEKRISTHTLCCAILHAHLHLRTGFASLSHVRRNLTEVNAVTVTYDHICDIRIWPRTCLHRWNWLCRIQEVCSETSSDTSAHLWDAVTTRLLIGNSNSLINL